MNFGQYTKAIVCAIVGLVALLLPGLGVNLDPQVTTALQTIIGTIAVWAATNQKA